MKSGQGYRRSWFKLVYLHIFYNNTETVINVTVHTNGIRKKEELMFKDFSIFSSGGHLVYRSGTILAILEGSHLGKIPMKFESHWPKGSGGVSF